MEASVNIYIMTNCRSVKTGNGIAAAVIEFVSKNGQKATKTLVDSYGVTTDNAMVLRHLEHAMECLTKACYITLYTSNEYVSGHLRLGSLKQWKENGWKNAHGHEIANRRVWESIEFLSQIHSLHIAESPSHEYHAYMRGELERYE